MDLTPTTTITAAAMAVNDIESAVDPFLVEALQNPRHRLTSNFSFALNLNFVFLSDLCIIGFSEVFFFLYIFF